MRKSLFTAAAMAPLLCALAAHAETTITGNTTAPVVTATANNGQPDDVTITTTGSVTLVDGVGVTVNSDNDFTNNGTISLTGDGANTGVLVVGPYNGDIVNPGAITVLEDYTPTDTNNDGIPDGPYAEAQNRYGIRVTGPFTGSLDMGGTVAVEGNSSFGVSLESSFVGDIDISGTINMTGNNNAAFRALGPISGDVLLAGAMNILGGSSMGVDLQGDVSGQLGIYGSITATGYRQIERNADPARVALLTPENLQQSGPAVRISGDVLGGVFLGAPPPPDDDDNDGVTDDDDEDDDNDDFDHDGIVDSIEGTAALTVFGGAPALLIGATGGDTHLGVFGLAEHQNDFGLIIRGSVQTFGVYDDINVNALQIGTGTGTTRIDGGVRVTGAVASTALQADAVTMRLMGGADVPRVRNEGQITASIASEDENSATALLIDQGGSLTSLYNQGTISALGNGDDVSSYAIVDRSGTLSNVTNRGFILTVINPATANLAPTGETVALDLSANTTGVTFVQDPNPNSTEETPLLPAVRGDILLGSGDDSVTLNAGTVIGALDFAGGDGSISINNGASYSGALTSAGQLAISVDDGLLDNRSAGALNASVLSVGDKGELRFGVDPVAGDIGRINVAGSATFEDGARIGVSILSLPIGQQTYNILQAQTLDVQGDPATLLGATPYLIVAGLDVDEADGSIDLSVRRRTAEEAGFNASEAGSYDAVYENIGRDQAILGAFLRQGEREGLINLYDQMLPDHAGGVLRVLSWAQEGASRAAADWPRAEESSGPTRAWTQEIGLGETKERSESDAWNAYAFGMAGGLESVSANGSALGFMVNFTTGNVTNPDTPGDDLVGVSQLGGGVYWRAAYAGFRADAQAGAGWVWVNSRRELIDNTGGVLVRRQNEAEWTGWSMYARGGLAYEWTRGALVIRPATSLDYFRLSESGYTEVGGGTGFDLEVDDRSSDVLALTSTVTLGYTFGDKVRYRPEFTFGWRHVLAGSGGRTTGRFTGATTPFELFGEPMDGGAPIVRAGLRVYSSWLDLLIDGGAEFRDEYTDLDLRLTARIVF